MLDFLDDWEFSDLSDLTDLDAAVHQRNGLRKVFGGARGDLAGARSCFARPEVRSSQVMSPSLR